MRRICLLVASASALTAAACGRRSDEGGDGWHQRGRRRGGRRSDWHRRLSGRSDDRQRRLGERRCDGRNGQSDAGQPIFRGSELLEHRLGGVRRLLPERRRFLDHHEPLGAPAPHRSRALPRAPVHGLEPDEQQQQPAGGLEHAHSRRPRRRASPSPSSGRSISATAPRRTTGSTCRTRRTPATGPSLPSSSRPSSIPRCASTSNGRTRSGTARSPRTPTRRRRARPLD